MMYTCCDIRAHIWRSFHTVTRNKKSPPPRSSTMPFAPSIDIARCSPGKVAPGTTVSPDVEWTTCSTCGKRTSSTTPVEVPEKGADTFSAHAPECSLDGLQEIEIPRLETCADPSRSLTACFGSEKTTRSGLGASFLNDSTSHEAEKYYFKRSD